MKHQHRNGTSAVRDRRPAIRESVVGRFRRMRATHAPSQGGGFTLIETIAAIVIVAVAIPAMMWTLAEAQRQRIDPVMTSRATWLATEKLEDVIADRHAPTRGWPHLTEANYPDESSIDDFPGFSRRVRFKETGPDLESAGTGYMIVTVTIEWTGSRGEAHEFDIATVLTEY